jgi:hypothetical protein
LLGPLRHCDPCHLLDVVHRGEQLPLEHDFLVIFLVQPTMRVLRQLVETRRGLVDDRVRVTNRIIANLKTYFPQVLERFREKDTGAFADFLERWPTLEAAKKARRSALDTFFRDHNVRYQSTSDRRIDALKQEEPSSDSSRRLPIVAPSWRTTSYSQFPLPTRSLGLARSFDLPGRRRVCASAVGWLGVWPFLWP